MIPALYLVEVNKRCLNVKGVGGNVADFGCIRDEIVEQALAEGQADANFVVLLDDGLYEVADLQAIAAVGRLIDWLRTED
jgi:hypothetical protein